MMAEIFMLDADVSSYIIRENPQQLRDVFVAHQKDSICISSVTYAELMFGLLNNHSERLEHKIKQFVSLVQILDWTDKAAIKYAEIKIFLKKSGTPIGNMDMLIAAAAIAAEAQLVSHNKKHFSLVPGLRIANWL